MEIETQQERIVVRVVLLSLPYLTKPELAIKLLGLKIFHAHFTVNLRDSSLQENTGCSL